MARRLVPASILVLLVLSAPVAATAADDVGALVDKTVAAYGGAEALSGAKVVLQEGTVSSTMRGITGTLRRVYERPGRLRVEIAYGKNAEVRVLDGSSGWRDGRTVVGPPFDAMVLQAARIDAPWLLRENRGKLVDRGRVDRDGKTCRALEIPLQGKLTLIVEIDPASGRILRTIGRSAAGGMSGMGGIEFINTYDEFREVGGVLFAFREQNYAMGQHTGETVLKTVELPGAPPAGAFKP